MVEAYRPNDNILFISGLSSVDSYDFFIVNFADFNNPVLVSKIILPDSPYSVHNFPIRNDRLLVSLISGVAIYDIQNLNNPTVIS